MGPRPLNVSCLYIYNSRVGQLVVAQYSLHEMIQQRIDQSSIFSHRSVTGITRVPMPSGPVSYTHLDVYKRQVEYKVRDISK